MIQSGTSSGNEIGSHRGTHLLVALASLVVIMYGINQAQSVLALIFLALFFALIGTPLVLWLEQKRIPSFAAVLLVMAAMVTLLMVIGAIVGASLSSFTNDLPSYQKRLQEQVLALKPLLASKQIIVTNKVLLEYLNPGSVIDLVVGLIADLGVALSNIVLILLMVTFILLEASTFPIKLRGVSGNPDQDFSGFKRFVSDMQRYVVIKTVINLIAGVTLGLWLFILGVDSPVLWGFLAFLLHYVPNVGSVICGIPAILLAFIQYGTGSALLVAAGYIAVGVVLGNVIEPRLMGRKLGLSALVVFLSLIFWGSLLGPVGMVLCVPLTMTLKFGLEINKETRWIGSLLGPVKATADDIPAPVDVASI
jgi:predicted PurR-regulated permease PerM